MKNYQFNKVHDEFGKKVLAAIPQVFSYVKHRLYVAETKGVIPRNMYKTNGIIDDAIVDLYKKYEGKLDKVDEIKLKLFALVEEHLRLLLKKEDFHKNTLSTSQILKNELKLMEENFDFDAGNDLIMHEELDDISYHQDDFKKSLFLYNNEEEKNIIKTLEIPIENSEITEKKRIAFNKIYHWLPTETSDILDLFIFGKLTYDEIALIKKVAVFEIKSNIQEVSTVFRKNVL